MIKPPFLTQFEKVEEIFQTIKEDYTRNEVISTGNISSLTEALWELNMITRIQSEKESEKENEQ